MCALSDVFDSLFSLSILMVSVDSSERQVLLGFCNGTLKFLCVKQSDVCMIVQDTDTVPIVYSFKLQFRFDSSLAI